MWSLHDDPVLLRVFTGCSGFPQHQFDSPASSLDQCTILNVELGGVCWTPTAFTTRNKVELLYKNTEASPHVTSRLQVLIARLLIKIVNVKIQLKTSERLWDITPLFILHLLRNFGDFRLPVRFPPDIQQKRNLRWHPLKSPFFPL